MPKTREEVLADLEYASTYAHVCSGEAASQHLKTALGLAQFVRERSEAVRITEQIKVWRAALKRHNEMPFRSVSFDVRNGDRLDC